MCQQLVFVAFTKYLPYSSEVNTSKEPKLKRSLTNRNIQLIALGGAIGTGLFMGSGSTINQAGPSILLVYMVIGMFMYIIMRAMGEILLADLSYKSFQDFAERLIGPWAGFVTGWTYWFLWVVIAIGDMIVVTGYFNFWIDNLVISTICTALLLLALVASNLLTVRLFGEIEFWFALIKIVAIIALILVGGGMVFYGFTGSNGVTASVTYLWDRGGFFPTGATGFFAAFSIAIYSFIGTELIGTTAAETHHPEKTVPKAINAVPIRIVLFYVLSLAVIMSITPWDLIDPKQSPFVTIFVMAGLGPAAAIMNFVVLTSAASSANSGIFSSSRMLFGLAQSGQASSRFARLSSHHVPAKALLFVGVLTALFVPILWLGGSILEGFTLISSVAATLVLAIWGLILVSYLCYYKKFPETHKNASYKLFGAAWTPWLGLGFIVGMCVVLGAYPDTRLALLLTPVWFILLGIAWAIRTKRVKARHN